MTTSRVYMDYNASCPLRTEVQERMASLLTVYGNPSSVHQEGRKVSALIENARETIASHAGVSFENVVFTSGATEAANFVLCPRFIIKGKQCFVSKLYVNSTEHPCVLEGGRFDISQVEKIAVTSDGIIDLDHLDNLLSNHDKDSGIAMVAIMAANNETGIIQPLDKIVDVVHIHDGILVVDAVQIFSKCKFNLSDMKIDFAFISGHKLGGPQGIGALLINSDDMVPIPLLKGGSQENRYRSGTENVLAIAGFEKAVAISCAELDLMDRLGEYRSRLERGLYEIAGEMNNNNLVPVIFGENQERIPNTICFSTLEIKAETAVIAFDLYGIAISSGSACSSGRVVRSHVLDAMGIPENISSNALRISLGWASKSDDIEYFLQVWRKIVSNKCISSVSYTG